jgi:hypothetical protein
MLSHRNRLLLLLVLLLAVATAGWKTALASEETGSAASSSLESVSRPPVAPTSGEPDVGQTPRPTITKGALLPVPPIEGEGTQDDPWVRWIFGTLAIWYLAAG